jgi:hypothetical protein
MLKRSLLTVAYLVTISLAIHWLQVGSAASIVGTRTATDNVAPRIAKKSCAVYHCIRYTINPQKLNDFETYARRWTEGGIIKRCGGEPLGYFLPKKGYGGADNIAIALIGFDSLAAYEEYRAKLSNDPEAQQNVDFANKSGCILSEDRSYYYRIGTVDTK